MLLLLLFVNVSFNSVGTLAQLGAHLLRGRQVDGVDIHIEISFAAFELVESGLVVYLPAASLALEHLTCCLPLNVVVEFKFLERASLRLLIFRRRLCYYILLFAVLGLGC